MLALLDYRRRVFELYAQIRQLGTASTEAYQSWVRARNQLFGEHSQSALDDGQRARFEGLQYYAYDPAYRVLATLDAVLNPAEYTVTLDDDGEFTMRQIGQVHFELPTGSGTLGVFWIAGYGGGVFIPFRDATNQQTTYGAGRYLYDTIKGADLGMEGDKMVLDFNYAYHPSCSYNHRWVCPLAPPQQHVAFPIEAGEKLLSL